MANAFKQNLRAAKPVHDGREFFLPNPPDAFEKAHL